MHLQTVIEQLGYTSNEARVFLSALSLGESTVTDLARKSKLPRTSTQLIIQKLEEDGLLNLFVKRNHKFWIAENPEKLLIKLKEREAALKNIMPELQGMRYEVGTARPVVRIYTGSEEIKRVMRDIIETKHHILGIIAWDEWRDFFGNQYVDDFIKERYGRYLRIRMLTPRTTNSMALKERDDKELRHTRFLAEEANIRNTNFIYGNKVAIISLNKRQPTGILIEDQDVTNTMTVMFESLWNQSLER